MIENVGFEIPAEAQTEEPAVYRLSTPWSSIVLSEPPDRFPVVEKLILIQRVSVLDRIVHP